MLKKERFKMSAFIVEDKTICAVVNFFAHHKDLQFLRKRLKEDGYDLEAEDRSGMIKLAQDMHDLNCRAVNVRYDEKPADEWHPQPFMFKLVDGYSMIDIIKGLSCWLFQCNEEDVDKDPLYVLLNDIVGDLSYFVVTRMPEYERSDAWK